MGHLTITFAGVCTHFTDLQKIDPNCPPHRVVLPPIADFRMGIVQAAFQPGQPTLGYYLQPHFATLRLGDTTPSIPGFTDNGLIMVPTRIQISNPSKTEKNKLHRSDWFQNPRYSLSTYLPDYELSPEIVLSGRAVCYFDLAYGNLYSPSPHSDPPKDSASSVVAEIDTDGAPLLTFTHLNGDGPIVMFELTDDAELLVSNLEIDASHIDEDTPFDFIQHYVTAKQGVPEAIAQELPGMSPDIVPNLQLNQSIATALRKLADAISTSEGPLRPTPESIRQLDPATLNPSCSDSHYP